MLISIKKEDLEKRISFIAKDYTNIGKYRVDITVNSNTNERHYS